MNVQAWQRVQTDWIQGKSAQTFLFRLPQNIQSRRSDSAVQHPALQRHHLQLLSRRVGVIIKLCKTGYRRKGRSPETILGDRDLV